MSLLIAGPHPFVWGINLKMLSASLAQEYTLAIQLHAVADPAADRSPSKSHYTDQVLYFGAQSQHDVTKIQRCIGMGAWAGAQGRRTLGPPLAAREGQVGVILFADNPYGSLSLLPSSPAALSDLGLSPLQRLSQIDGNVLPKVFRATMVMLPRTRTTNFAQLRRQPNLD